MTWPLVNIPFTKKTSRRPFYKTYCCSNVHIHSSVSQLASKQRLHPRMTGLCLIQQHEPEFKKCIGYICLYWCHFQFYFTFIFMQMMGQYSFCVAQKQQGHMSFLGVSIGYTAAPWDTGYYKQSIFSSRCFEDSLGIYLFKTWLGVYFSQKRKDAYFCNSHGKWKMGRNWS